MFSLGKDTVHWLKACILHLNVNCQVWPCPLLFPPVGSFQCIQPESLPALECPASAAWFFHSLSSGSFNAYERGVVNISKCFFFIAVLCRNIYSRLIFIVAINLSSRKSDTLYTLCLVSFFTLAYYKEWQLEMHRLQFSWPIPISDFWEV